MSIFQHEMDQDEVRDVVGQAMSDKTPLTFLTTMGTPITDVEVVEVTPLSFFYFQKNSQNGSGTRKARFNEVTTAELVAA
jgi:hypothetical protein